MGFDLATAKPIEDSGGFDLSTAKPVTDTPAPDKPGKTGDVMSPYDAGAIRDASFPRATPAIRRFALEAGGATAGAIVGAPLGPQGSMAGGGLGYAGGKLLSDYLEELSGTRKSPDALGRIADVGKDFSIGALLQGAGESGMSALKMAFEWGKRKAAMNGIALTKDDILAKAKEILQSSMGKTPANPATVAESERLAAEIPGYKPSLAEGTGDVDLIRLQQSLARQPGGMGVEVGHRQANREALSKYLTDAFPGGGSIDDVLAQVGKNSSAADLAQTQATGKVGEAVGKLAGKESQTVGNEIYGAVKKAMEPVLQKEKELWSNIANYKINTTETNKAFLDAIEIPSTAQPLIKRLKKIYDAGESNANVQWLQGQIEREIDSAIRNQATTATERHFLKNIKDGINKDISNLGEAADQGRLFVSGKKLVYPDKIKTEIDSLSQQIAEAEKNITARPNYDAVIAGLKEKSIPFMRLVNESDEGFKARILGDYKRAISPDIPMNEPVPPAGLPGMKSRLAGYQAELASAQPAENVATQVKEAKNFSRDQKFSRFDKGAVRDMLRPGNAPNNRTIPDAEIAGRFMKPDNADQLIKAVGSNNDAGKLMEGFITSNMESAAINPTTGELVPSAFNKWLSKNKSVIEKYGLTGKFENIGKAQESLTAAKTANDQFSKSVAAKMLNVDPEKAISVAMSGTGGRSTGETMKQLMDQVKSSPDAIQGLKNSFKDFMVKEAQNTADAITGGQIISNTKIQSVLAKYDPAMKVLYGEGSREYKALRNVQKAVETSYRSIPSPLGGGSNTAEQAASGFDLLSKVVGMPGLKMGPVGSFAIRVAQRGLSVFTKISEQDVTTVLRRAMYDPDLAKDLLLAKQGLAPEVVERNLGAKLIAMGILTTKP